MLKRYVGSRKKIKITIERDVKQVKSIVADIETDEHLEQHYILHAAFEMMRRLRKSTWYEESSDMYNDAVYCINTDRLDEAMKHFDVLTRVRRGLPLTETINMIDFTNRNPVRAAMSLLKKAWADGSCNSLSRVPNQYVCSG